MRASGRREEVPRDRRIGLVARTKFTRASEGGVEAKFMVPGNDDLVRVWQGGQPGVEFADLQQFSVQTSESITGWY